ncbi:MAG TPA: nitroreductase/quinone reductase family protein [Candidatus Limnocylindrales bacterium]|nr:nitroreductase/quinone reductase family protein [Candidatus Limnocylindrales bacterium]
MTTPARVPSDPALAKPFTETTRFKVMRTLVGASNPLIAAVLRRGSGGPMAKQLTLLRFRGRRSGRWYETPIGYVRDGDTVVLVTSPGYSWWRNVRDGADVDLRLDGAWRTGHARIVRPDDPAYDETVALQVARRGPGMLRTSGVQVDDTGHVPPEAREAAAAAAHIVRVELGGAAPDRR